MLGRIAEADPFQKSGVMARNQESANKAGRVQETWKSRRQRTHAALNKAIGDASFDYPVPQDKPQIKVRQKSLSNVRRIRPSRAAWASTSLSEEPGAEILTQITSWPASVSARTVDAGTFSSARKRTSVGGWVNSLSAQRIARVSQTREDILARQPGIVGQNFGFAPSVREETDHEFDRQSGATNNGFTGQHRWIERDGRLFHVHELRFLGYSGA